MCGLHKALTVMLRLFIVLQVLWFRNDLRLHDNYIVDQVKYQTRVRV
jgi:hypothetical protein